MAAIGFGRESGDSDVVFLHATGFNARAYRSLLAPLGGRYQVLALDFRGHGRTTLPARLAGYASWAVHRDDVITVLERHLHAPVTLAGHSLGGSVAALVAAKRPDLVASLALIEPVILSRRRLLAINAPLAPLLLRLVFPLARAAARRRAHFPDRETAVEAFTGRGVFKVFSREQIEDYVADGLLEDCNGGFKLACAPAYESASFSAHRNRIWTALARIGCPLVVLRAAKHSTMAASAARWLGAAKPQARLASIEGAGHMLPMERPDRVRAAIETALLMRGQG